MTAKLILTMEKSVIEKAERYAKGTQRSLSEMIQKYLENIGESEPAKNKSSKIDELAGSFPMPKDFDYEPLSPKVKKMLEMLPKNIPQYSDEELDNMKREYLEKKYL
ncbi:MAG: DUF6364 family protein [Flavobacteriaceae bacterium]|jgi:predicted CopG family antitoxin|nr:DUF6364 family protein [Flavobacteriaceae bacterium]